MSNPRWSELAAELGIDWPRHGAADPPPPLRPASEAPRGLPPDEPASEDVRITEKDEATPPDEPDPPAGTMVVSDPDARDAEWNSAPDLSTRDDDRFDDLGAHIAHVLRVAHDTMGDMRHLERQLAELRSVHASVGRALTEASSELQASLDRLDLDR